MLDHVIITVTDYLRSKEFYEKALEPPRTGRPWTRSTRLLPQPAARTTVRPGCGPTSTTTERSYTTPIVSF